jgi:single-stranded-DNA-specific exonuclease
LVTENEDEALELARQLDGLNRERRDIEARMRSQAEELVDAEHMLEMEKSPYVVCLFREDWHEGLVGLVASRIKERCHRPVIAFAPSRSGVLKGSGRSVPGFHLRDALAHVAGTQPGLIERFGGHAMAAGLTIRSDVFESFQAAMELEAKARMNAEMLSGRIFTDGELQPEDFTVEVAAILREAGPWGQGFPEPCFEGSFDIVKQRTVRDAHLKMTLKPVGGDCLLDGIAFNRKPGDWEVGARVRLVYRLEVNNFYRTPAVQLMVDHIEVAC